jgi:hypothetical protein
MLCIRSLLTLTHTCPRRSKTWQTSFWKSWTCSHCLWMWVAGCSRYILFVGLFCLGTGSHLTLTIDQGISSLVGLFWLGTGSLLTLTIDQGISSLVGLFWLCTGSLLTLTIEVEAGVAIHAGRHRDAVLVRRPSKHTTKKKFSKPEIKKMIHKY